MNSSMNFEKYGGYIDFQVAGKLISYVTIDKLRLYYQQGKNLTFEHLISQYKQFTGNNIQFKIGSIKIPNNCLIEALFVDLQIKKMFERLNSSSYNNKPAVKSIESIERQIINQKLLVQINSKSALWQKQIKNHKQLAIQRLIYWVDDEPENNIQMIEQLKEQMNIKISQLLSTKQLKVVMQDTFAVQIKRGMHIIIISDMTRKQQDGKWNYEAGVDLFELLYNEYGYKNKAIIFTTNKQNAIQKISKRGIKCQNWCIATLNEQLKKQIKFQFENMQNKI